MGYLSWESMGKSTAPLTLQALPSCQQTAPRRVESSTREHDAWHCPQHILLNFGRCRQATSSAAGGPATSELLLRELKLTISHKSFYLLHIPILVNEVPEQQPGHSRLTSYWAILGSTVILGSRMRVSRMLMRGTYSTPMAVSISCWSPFCGCPFNRGPTVWGLHMYIYIYMVPPFPVPHLPSHFFAVRCCSKLKNEKKKKNT